MGREQNMESDWRDEKIIVSKEVRGRDNAVVGKVIKRMRNKKICGG